MLKGEIMASRHAFTLIELLIVVAIIAILAAIAVPNFLQAQTRAKVSRLQSDMRSIGGALEAYRVDHNDYPPAATSDPDLQHSPDWPVIMPPWKRLIPLTTPVAYLASAPQDPFWGGGWGYVYGEKESMKDLRGATAWNQWEPHLWMLSSKGPDADWDHDPENPYDPTNGTISNGDIYRFGP